jgi:hypothetical protein
LRARVSGDGWHFAAVKSAAQTRVRGESLGVAAGEVQLRGQGRSQVPSSS